MNKLFILTLLGGVFFSSCKKEKPVTETVNTFISGTADGVAFTGPSNCLGNGLAGVGGAWFNPNATTADIGIFVNIKNYSYTACYNALAPGAVPFNHSSTPHAIFLFTAPFNSPADSTCESWASDQGYDTTDSLYITARGPLPDTTLTPPFATWFSGHFTCKVYDCSGASKTIQAQFTCNANLYPFH